ncbi:MAG: hypothetical protein AAFY71_10050 [Bacteroidota bacterium]
MKRLTLSFCCLIFLLGTGRLEAQIKTGQESSLSGRFYLQYQFYNINGSNGAPSFQRRQNNLIRFRGYGTYKVNKDLSVPYKIMLQNHPFNFLTPRGVSEKTGIISFLTHPGNQLYFAPSTKDYKLELGSIVPYYSSLSTGDVQIFGLGGSAQVSGLKIYAHTGMINRAFNRSTSNFNGNFFRSQISARVEKQVNDQHQLGVNLVRIRDWQNSISDTTTEAIQNNIISVNDRFRLSSKVSGEAELATGLSKGMAANFQLTFREKNWGVGVKTRWLGKDYIILAAPQLQSDRLDIIVSPNYRTLDNKWIVNGSIGLRSNNLSQLGDPTFTRQILASFNAMGQLDDNWSINVSAANYGVRNQVISDTLRIQMVSRSAILAPQYKINTGDVQHVIRPTFQLQAFTDFNALTSELNDLTSTNIDLTYELILAKMSGGATVSFFNNSTQFTPNQNISFTLYGKGKFLQDRLAPFAYITILNASGTSFPVGNKLLIRLGGKYTLDGKTQASLLLSNHNYRFGAAGMNPVTNEFRAQLSLYRQL